MSRPGLSWIVRRLVLCKHSHNDVGTRYSKNGKVMNRSPDAGTSAASLLSNRLAPGVGERCFRPGERRQ